MITTDWWGVILDSHGFTHYVSREVETKQTQVYGENYSIISHQDRQSRGCQNVRCNLVFILEIYQVKVLDQNH